MDDVGGGDGADIGVANGDDGTVAGYHNVNGSG